jgi:tetratricopeptide (TPR) repeat protein
MISTEEKTQVLSWAELGKLMQPEIGPEARQAIVRTLISEAARSRREGIPAPRELQWREAAYEKPIQRAVAEARRGQERLMQERRNAGRLWEILESHPPSRRRILARNDRRFQNWGLYDCLIERVHNFLDRDPAVAVESAELALAVAQGLSPATYGEERVYDFQAEALVALGQARRVAGDLEDAQEALNRAGAILKLGSGDPLEKAELESARAALLRDQGHVEEAEAAGRRALVLSHRAGGPRDRSRQRGLDDSHPDLRRGGRFPIQGFRPRQH